MASPIKSKMAAAAVFNFRKMSITAHWIKISAPNFMGRCIMAMRRWPRDQMSKPEVNSLTSSNEGLKDKCVDLSDYSLTDIWTKFGTEDKYHTINMPELARPNSHNLKIQDGGCRHVEFRKNVNNSGLNKDISTKFYGKMLHGHGEMTTWWKVENRS